MEMNEDNTYKRNMWSRIYQFSYDGMRDHKEIPYI